MSLRKNLFKTIFTSTGIMILSFLINIPVTRILGPENKGIYAYLFFFPGLSVGFMTFGLTASITYYTAKLRSQYEQLAALVLWYTAGLSFLSALVFLGYVFVTNDQMFIDNWYYIFLVIFCLPLMLLYNFVHAYVQGLKDFNCFNIADWILNIGMFLISLLFAWYGAAYFALFLFANVVVYLVPSVYMVYKHREHFSGFLKIIPQSSLFFDQVRYGLKTYVNSFLHYVNINVDAFFVARMLGMADLGLYNLADSLISKFRVVMNSFSLVLLPHNSATNGNYQLTAKLCRINLFLGVIGGVFVCLFAKPVIVFLYSERFSGSIIPMLLLVPGVIFYMVTNLLAADLAARNHLVQMSIIGGICVLIHIGLDAVLITHYQVAGVTMAYTLSTLLPLLITLVVYSRLVPEAKIKDMLLIKYEDVQQGFDIVSARILKKKIG